MDELILRVLRGEATPFEVERLRRWRSEGEANELHFQALSRIWQLSGPDPLAPFPEEATDEDVDPLLPIIQAAAEERRMAAPTPLKPASAQRSRSRSHRFRLRAVAGWGTALAAGLGALSLGIHRMVPSPAAPAPSTRVVASAPKPQTLQLDDGSFVRLAPGARLDVHFREEERRVALQGRAFFAVAPNPGRPFLVESGNATVRVLGTRFEVKEEGDAVRTVVVEGRVALASPAGEVEVPAGSVGRAIPGTPPGANPVPDPWSLLDWPGGLLVFHETPLADVVREVEEHFGTSVSLRTSGAEARRVSASFQAEESFREVVETLCVITSTTCRISPDSALIVSSPGVDR